MPIVGSTTKDRGGSLSRRARFGHWSHEGPERLEYGLTPDGEPFIGGAVFVDDREFLDMLIIMLGLMTSKFLEK